MTSPDDATVVRVLAETLWERYKQEVGLTPYQRTDSELLYGGHDSKGLWIYRRKDGSFHGCNYDSKEALEEDECDQFTKRYDFLHSTDALRPVLAKLTPEEWHNLFELLYDTCVPHPDATGRIATIIRNVITLDPPVLARAVAEAIQACAGQKGGG